MEMESKNKENISTELNLLNIKKDLQLSLMDKNGNNNIIKKKCKCPELLHRKTKHNFDEDLPYHIKKKFTKNILLSEKDDKIVLISTNEYNKHNKPPKEEKSNNKLPQVTSTKNKIKIDSKININAEEVDNENNLKDILCEISEISADLELFEMEKRKRKMMKLIELMADRLDNNIASPNELIDLYTFNKK